MSFKALSYKVKAGFDKIIILFLASQKCGAFLNAAIRGHKPSWEMQNGNKKIKEK